jgi:hypothetical protein
MRNKITNDFNKLDLDKLSEVLNELIDKIDEVKKLAEKVEKKECCKKSADVNKDGKVDEKDLSVVHKEYHKEKAVKPARKPVKTRKPKSE